MTAAAPDPFARPVLVTGAGGFLGAALVRRLVARGARVRALLGPADEPRLTAPPPGVDAARGDIEDGALLARLCDGAGCVFHLAGPPSVAESFAAPARYLRVHAAGTAAVVEAAIAAGVDHVVHVSSAEVYAAAAGQPVGEDHPRAPRSPYGIAKLAAEQLLEACAAAGRIRASILRPFSIYGPGASPRSLIATLVAAVARGEPARYADPRPVRDYCFVDDAVAAIAACAGRGGPPGRAYNVASGRGVSVADVARALHAIAGRGDAPVHAADPDRPAPAITLELVGDPARARDELGVSAATPLAVGLERTLAAQRMEA